MGKQPTPEYPSEQKQPQDLCHLSCDFIAEERNRYYTGKYMTARDFQDEQDYFVSRNRLHNRLLHGWGIVCGLNVIPHPNPNCHDRYVVVTPGIAIDCCGRELILREKTVLKIWDPEPVSAKEIKAATTALAEIKEEIEVIEEVEEELEEVEEVLERKTRRDRTREAEEKREREAEREREEEEEKEAFVIPDYIKRGGPFLLVIRYEEEALEFSPALYAENACDPRHQEANRVREIACLEAIRWDKDRHAGCWPIPEPDKPKERIPCRMDCEDPGKDSPGCLEAFCECAVGVPLALVEPVFLTKSLEWDINAEWIHWRGRHELRTPPEYLTHIVDFNWKHGETINLSHVIDPDGMDGKLKIYFDRPLYKNPHDKGIGVNEHTYVVMYHRQADIAYNLQVLFDDDSPPYVEEENGQCCAVFTIDREMLRGNVNIGDCVIYVTLKCDFILDCHHHAVDGEHLGGVTPTGDGMAGGNFESWFRIANDIRRPPRKTRV